MTLDGCLFAVQARDPQAAASIERRLGRLEGFYRPLGGLGSSRRRVDALRLLFGALDFDGRGRDQTAVSSWGGRLPAALEVPAALGRASDAELRTLPSAVAAIDVGDDRATLITGPVAPTMLYEASSAQATAWSTHAVACAYLARGEARIDPAALPEFIAAEFVGGDRSLVEGVRALPAATRVTVTANEVERRSYWPASERWAVREGAELQAEAERALLSTLPAALAGASSPVLGLTGGADSRVAAVALRELGREFETMTFGEADWEDVQAAQRLAQTLGVPHSFRELEWWDDEEALGRAGAAGPVERGGDPHRLRARHLRRGDGRLDHRRRRGDRPRLLSPPPRGAGRGAGRRRAGPRRDRQPGAEARPGPPRGGGALSRARRRVGR